MLLLLTAAVGITSLKALERIPHGSHCHIWLVTATRRLARSQLTRRGSGWACGSLPASRGAARLLVGRDASLEWS